MTPNEQKIPTVVRNEFFYLFARICMVVASLIGLPIAGFMMNRVIGKADDISEKVEKQNLALQLLLSDAKFRFAAIDDHEKRIRTLEARK